MAETVLGVLVSGRGSNLQAILDEIKNGRLNARVGIVVSDNPDAAALSRLAGSDIPAICISRKQFLTRDEFEMRLASELESKGVELVVLAGFMRLLGPLFIRRFPGRIMNIHPSLLPAFPGLDAQGQAIRYGVKISGCTVHIVDEGMDSGPIILQAAVLVHVDDTPDLLSERILAQEHVLYPQAIALFAQGRIEIRGRKVRILDSEEVEI